MTSGKNLLDMALAGEALDAQRAALMRGLRERGVGEDALARVMAHVRDGIGLSGDMAAGRTRLGGPGVLPQGVSWPTLPGFSDWHLGFLMEIVLEELPRLAPLPPSGRLLIYQDMEMFGLQNDSLETTRVLYVADGEPTITCDPPERTVWSLAGKRLGARAMPIAGEPALTVESLAVADRDVVIDAMNDLVPAQWEARKHWLLGSALEIQESLPEAIQGEIAALAPAQRGLFSSELQGGQGWRLLAQIHEDYDAEIGLDFGIADGGALFICVPEADLLAMRFDRVIGFAQSH
jgi:hypothetical protein